MHPQSDGGGTWGIKKSPKHLKRGGEDKRGAGGRHSEGDGEEDLGTVCLATAGRRGPGACYWEKGLSAGLPSGRGWSWSRLFSRIPDLIEEELEDWGVGGLRGQGSELSRDPTTTNARQANLWAPGERPHRHWVGGGGHLVPNEPSGKVLAKKNKKGTFWILLSLFFDCIVLIMLLIWWGLPGRNMSRSQSSS